MTKIVSQLDAQGYLIGAAVADESPLEPGVYLMPGGCVDVAPIQIPSGKLARWSDGWVFEDEPLAPVQPPEPVVDPRIKRLAEIDQEAALTPRAFRELVILTTEGFRLATSGTLDLKAIVPGVARVFDLEEEAVTIRNQLSSGD